MQHTREVKALETLTALEQDKAEGSGSHAPDGYLQGSRGTEDNASS